MATLSKSLSVQTELVYICFVGETEQKRRAQSFLSGQEPKAGKLVRKETPRKLLFNFLNLP